jgi:hypothetical protein
MKFTCFWRDVYGNGKLYPKCSSDFEGKGQDSLLCWQFVDSGGVGLDTSSAWIEEGIARIDAVATGQPAERWWSSEVFITDLAVDGVKIYELYDESHFETCSLSAFRKAMVEWLGFIRSAPDVNNRVEVEI